MTASSTICLRKKKHYLREIFGFACVNCGKNKKCDFAHIVSTTLSFSNGRGSWQRYRDIIKNPNKYTYLCRTCHNLYDKYGSGIRVLSLQEIAKQRGYELPTIKRKVEIIIENKN